jgi:hypothetical protein
MKKKLGAHMHARKGLVESLRKEARMHERDYATHDLALASIAHAFKMWRQYLMGRKFTLKTNHSSLKHLFEQPTLNFK